MENTSDSGKPPGERPTLDEAHSTLEVIDSAQRQALAPMPYPPWYWVSTTAGLGAAVAAGAIENPAISVSVTLGYLIFVSAATAKLKNRNGRMVDSALMPRRLMLARILPLAVVFPLFIGIGYPILQTGWPQRWIVFAVLGMVGAIISGPVADSIYRRAYARWLAERSS